MNAIRHFTTCVTCFSMLCSFSAYSAELNVPRTVDVLAINGVRVKEKQNYTLNSGDNQLVIRYSQVLKKGSLKRQFESKPYVVSILAVNPTSHYHIGHKNFLNYSSAEAAFKNNKVDWVLKTDNDSEMLETNELPGNPGFLPYQDIEKAIANFNQRTGRDISISEPVATSPGSAEFVKDIKSWYLNASDSERKSLLKWMIEQQ